MLYFRCASDADLATLRGGGVLAPATPFDDLAAAQTACPERVLVLDTPTETPSASEVLNFDPYLPPRSVIAAGGYVVRRTDAGPEVLLIFRRGVWDLPKGKQDPGETPEETAVREVKEEVGIEVLERVRPLGTTVHGYPDGAHYAVKTTYWYEMRTPEVAFKPEAGEQIERVEYVPWATAKARIGYDSLRRHMEQVSGF